MEHSKPIKRDCFIKKICQAGMLSTLLPFSSAPANDDKKFHLLDHPRHKRDFDDCRSYKVIFLAHCITNMNARMHKCATFPAAVKPIVEFCLEHDIGMIQLPCGELMVTGLGRDRDEPEQEYLRQALEMPVARTRIRQVAEQVVFQMKEYRFQGFTMLGVLGKNGSPTCGVETTAFPDPEKRFGPGQGVFIQELELLMKEAGLEIPVKGFDDAKPEESVDWIRENLRRAG